MRTPTSPGLRGRVAIVTGAGRGLGRAIAVALSDAGASVVLCARDTSALTETASALSGPSLVVETDVTRHDDVQHAVDAAITEFGHIDALVANSGIAGPTKNLWELGPDEWDETFAVNVRGVYSCAHAVLPHLISRGSGALVVIGSATGKRPLAGRTPYAASKTALIGLIRTLATELAPYRIRANLVSPGPIAGERLDGVIAAQAAERGVSVAEARELLFGDSIVVPEEIAAAVRFLVSDAASGITGEDLNVSRGLVTY